MSTELRGGGDDPAREGDVRDVRRYVTIVQDPRGYPKPGRLDKAPPDGPEPPAIHSVVMADDFERLERRYLAIVRTLRQAATDLSVCETAFRKMDEGTEGTPPHVRQRDAERARERVLAVISEYVGEND